MEKTSIDGRIIPTINGGYGSGNFGHSGRPGKVGGSGKSSGGGAMEQKHDKNVKDLEKHDFDVDGYRGSTQELDRLFPEGDNFYSDGELMHVKKDDNGNLYGESEDGKRVVETPGQVIDGTARYMASGKNASKRLDAFSEISSRLARHGVPKMATEELMRYAVAEHDFASAPTKEGLKRVESYADTARGALKGYAENNGGIDRRPSNGMQRWVKAVSDQIWQGLVSARDIEERTREE